MDLSKLEEIIEEIGYKKYRINTEEELLKKLQKPFKQELKCVITVFNRKTINYENIEDIQQVTNSEVVIQCGFVSWSSWTFYKKEDCFIICLLERED